MVDWFTTHGWAAWGVAGLALAAAELLTLDLTLLMLSVGAFAGALTALVAPTLWWLQVLVALSVAVAMLFVLRPTLLNKVRQAPGYRSSLESLVGSPGIATAEITGVAGEVKVAGQIWEARSFDPTIPIANGDQVEVYSLDGVTLIVYPADPPPQLGSRGF